MVSFKGNRRKTTAVRRRVESLEMKGFLKEEEEEREEKGGQEEAKEKVDEKKKGGRMGISGREEKRQVVLAGLAADRL